MSQILFRYKGAPVDDILRVGAGQVLSLRFIPNGKNNVAGEGATAATVKIQHHRTPVSLTWCLSKVEGEMTGGDQRYFDSVPSTMLNITFSSGAARGTTIPVDTGEWFLNVRNEGPANEWVISVQTY